MSLVILLKGIFESLNDIIDSVNAVEHKVAFSPDDESRISVLVLAGYKWACLHQKCPYNELLNKYTLEAVDAKLREMRRKSVGECRATGKKKKDISLRSSL